MATSTLFDDPSIPSFHEYPTRRPFLNAEITRSPGKPAKSYPESNAQAVLSALKGLQEKIKKLEVERVQAEKNLKTLATETDLYKELLSSKSPEKQESPSPRDPSSSIPLRKTRFASPVSSAPHHYSPMSSADEVENQLRGADTRCKILERQLENMRKMVQNAEKERSEALERQIALEKDRGRMTAQHREAQEKLSRLADVEDRYRDLACEKAATESRIMDLEEKLKLEEHQRKLLADKAALLQTEAESNRILLQTQIPSQDVESEATSSKTKPKKKSSVKKKKKSRPSSASSASAQSTGKKTAAKPSPQVARQAGQPHYRLNLGDVPFVAGTNAGSSHAVGANLQKVLFDLKQHNPIYCNDIVVSDVRMDDRVSDEEEYPSRGRVTASVKSDNKTGYSSAARPADTVEDLSELLLALQDEFGKMTFEHQVLVKQIGEITDPSLKEDLEKELESVVKKMEQKGEHIATVRRHRAMVESAIKQATPEKKQNIPVRPLLPLHQQYPSTRSRSASGVRKQTQPSCVNRRGCSVKSLSASSSPSGKFPGTDSRRNRLAFLRDMKTVHSALRKDDVSWD